MPATAEVGNTTIAAARAAIANLLFTDFLLCESDCMGIKFNA